MLKANKNDLATRIEALPSPVKKHEAESVNCTRCIIRYHGLSA
jgi:hypothetical protein